MGKINYQVSWKQVDQKKGSSFKYRGKGDDYTQRGIDVRGVIDDLVDQLDKVDWIKVSIIDGQKYFPIWGMSFGVFDSINSFTRTDKLSVSLFAMGIDYEEKVTDLDSRKYYSFNEIAPTAIFDQGASVLLYK